MRNSFRNCSRTSRKTFALKSLNLEMVSDDENVLKKFITGDESWVYGYDPETLQQSSQWKRPDEPRLDMVPKSEPCQVNADYFFRL